MTGNNTIKESVPTMMLAQGPYCSVDCMRCGKRIAQEFRKYVFEWKRACFLACAKCAEELMASTETEYLKVGERRLAYLECYRCGVSYQISYPTSDNNPLLCDKCKTHQPKGANVE